MDMVTNGVTASSIAPRPRRKESHCPACPSTRYQPEEVWRLLEKKEAAEIARPPCVQVHCYCLHGRLQNIGIRISIVDRIFDGIRYQFDIILHTLFCTGQARFCRHCPQRCFDPSANFCANCGHHLAPLAVDSIDGRDGRNVDPATPTSASGNPVMRATLSEQVFACIRMRHSPLHWPGLIYTVYSFSPATCPVLVNGCVAH